MEKPLGILKEGVSDNFSTILECVQTWGIYICNCSEGLRLIVIVML